MVLMLLLCVARRGELRRNLPYFSFAALLAMISAGLIAYVVTNLGTLLRLRLMFAVPMWLSALALMPASLATRRAYDDGGVLARERAEPGHVLKCAE
jgi:hypothetical protein